MHPNDYLTPPAPVYCNMCHAVWDNISPMLKVHHGKVIGVDEISLNQGEWELYCLDCAKIIMNEGGLI